MSGTVTFFLVRFGCHRCPLCHSFVDDVSSLCSWRHYSARHTQKPILPSYFSLFFLSISRFAATILPFNRLLRLAGGQLQSSCSPFPIISLLRRTTTTIKSNSSSQIRWPPDDSMITHLSFPFLTSPILISRITFLLHNDNTKKSAYSLQTALIVKPKIWQFSKTS